MKNISSDLLRIVRRSSVSVLLVSCPLSADSFEEMYPDFACEVDTGPIGNANEITNDYLMNLGRDQNGQELIDRIYARSTAGSMPTGTYRGQVIPAKSQTLAKAKVFLQSLGIPELFLNENVVKSIAESLWHGKKFKVDPDAVANAPTRLLVNDMPATSVKQLFELFKLPSPSLQNANGWRFPAKVYCGLSLSDTRRESIIIDYAHTETVDDSRIDSNPETVIKYNPSIDYLAGREMLQIRDEIRMVRPGFYLGRAYMGRVFVLNFTLECLDGPCLTVKNEPTESCDIGAQRKAKRSQACMPLAEFRNP